MIHRYSVNNGMNEPVEEPDSLGQYVRYTDHLAALAARDETIRVLREKLDRFAEIVWHTDGFPGDYTQVVARLDTSYFEVVYRENGQWLRNEDEPPVVVEMWCHIPHWDESWADELGVRAMRADRLATDAAGVIPTPESGTREEA